MNKGKIIVIEGTDGSGKQMQSKKLYERLLAEGKKVVMQSFPNYESTSSGPVKLYLSGALGENANDIDAYQASVLFGVDRFCTMKNFEVFYKNGGIIVLDRYVQSNMIHQACKIKDENERIKYINWLNEFEFELLKLPKPDKIFFLDVPPEISKKLREQRGVLKNGEKKDIHEADDSHIINAYNTAKWICEKYNWDKIDCINEFGDLKTIDEIHEIIYNKLK